ncbi:MAG: tyrosine-type recombinase/integrase [Clostridium sp.]|nr:tyrosine-type recombinase/integrase [Clostridium sp.]
MDSKRRDAKGRVLRAGESQQKDGRYRYTYYRNGRQHCFYSWKLEDTDRVPQGKRSCESLRSKIKELNKSLEQGIAFRGNGITVLRLAEKYLALQNANGKLRTSTKTGYRTSFNHIKAATFAMARIDKVKKSDAKGWMIALRESGLGYSTISSIFSLLKLSFRMAVEDDLIMKNPFDFVLTEYVPDDSRKKDALTSGEQDSLLAFIKNDRYYSQYYDAVVVLFETGLRIAEFCGLTTDNIDMERRTIKIDTQLHKDKDGYYLEPPKTAAGSRTVPMTDKAYECFVRLIENRTEKQKKRCVEGRKGYLCFDRNDMPRYGGQWDKIFENIWEQYRKQCQGAVNKVTPHICRHTFATNMVLKGMNPAILKQILGHDDISTTFKIYTHLKADNSMDEIVRLGLASGQTAEKEEKANIMSFGNKSA